MVTIPHRPTDSGQFGNSEWIAAAPFNVDDGKVKRCLQNRPNHRSQAVSVNSPWTGQRGDGPDGAARDCRLSRPHGIFVSTAGRVFVADSESHRIRILE
jgi:hypothetical protein